MSVFMPSSNLSTKPTKQNIFGIWRYWDDIGITIVMIDSCDDRNITMETHKWFTVGIQLVW